MENSRLSQFLTVLLLVFVSCSGPMKSLREYPHYFPRYGECGYTSAFEPPLPREVIGDSEHIRYIEGRSFYRNPNHLGVDFPADEGTEVCAGVTGCVVYYGPDSAFGGLVAVISADTRDPKVVVDGLGTERTVKRFIILYGCIRSTKEFHPDKFSRRSDTHLKEGDRVAPETIIGWVERRSAVHDSMQCLHYAVRLQSWLEAFALSEFGALTYENYNSKLAEYYADPAQLFVWRGSAVKPDLQK